MKLLAMVKKVLVLGDKPAYKSKTVQGIAGLAFVPQVVDLVAELLPMVPEPTLTAVFTLICAAYAFYGRMTVKK